MGAKSLIGTEDVRSIDSFWRAVLAEFVGTFILVAVGCGSCIAWDEKPSVVHIALTFGFVIASLVQAIGHISGCNINPGVTVGLLVSGHVGLIKAVLYIAAQCAGAVAGAAALKWVLPPNVIGGLGATGLAEGVLPWQGVVIEGFITFVLVLVVQAVCDPNRTDLVNAAPVAVGLAIATCHLFAVKPTGSGMNPARALGPAAIQQTWDNHWVYWLGPLIGGAVAGTVYRLIFRANKEEQNSYDL